MSATNFYQTFYQTEQLFRLADEPWGVVEQADEPSLAEDLLVVADSPATIDLRRSADFLTELEQLAAPAETVFDYR